MSTSLTDPLLLTGIIAGTAGLTLLAHAHTQSRLLRRRIAAGVGTPIIDAPTGLYSPEAARQCIRAEANRASRLERPLDLWIGSASDAEQLDALGRELVFSLPSGMTGMRLDPRRVCLVSCADVVAPIHELDALTWDHRRIVADDDAMHHTIAFLAEVSHG